MQTEKVPGICKIVLTDREKSAVFSGLVICEGPSRLASYSSDAKAFRKRSLIVILLVIGILVALATLFLGLSFEGVLGRNDDSHVGSTPRVGSTPLDFDLTGYDLPPEELDKGLTRSREQESEVDVNLFAMEDSSDASKTLIMSRKMTGTFCVVNLSL